MLNFITWDVSPEMISIGPVTVRWYGLMFVIGFVIGYWIVARMFKHEGAKQKWLDILLLYLIAGTVIGARLGHVFFYDWGYYSHHPLEILYIWKGGLASHGGTIGCIIAVLLFSRFTAHHRPSWTFDKVVVPIALVGALIRLGNLFNSEIYGAVTDRPWGFIFVRDGQVDPAHPTQLYEAACYLVLFALLMWMYWKRNSQERPWLNTGVFFIWVFGSRFVIEYIKNVQEVWELQLRATCGMDMGQILSLPFILVGAVMVIWAMTHPRIPMKFPNQYSDAK